MRWHNPERVSSPAPKPQILVSNREALKKAPFHMKGKERQF
jgi:hypothetical protein